MKNVLIVIHDMAGGGGQKSLLSFLKAFSGTKEIENYSIDIMVAKPKGIFLTQIPQVYNLIQAPKELLWLGTPTKDKILRSNFSVKGFFGKLKWGLCKKSKQWSALNEEQRLWENWKDLIPNNNTQYDIAISYMNGYPNYYVMDKIQAKRKVLWIHNEYQKLKYFSEYDRPYYEKCHKIITISAICERSFVEVFPEFAQKISVLENITLTEDILKRGEEGGSQEFGNAKYKILSVGRYCEQKGFDYAIDAAAKLKEKLSDFMWLFVGEGPDREKLQQQIDSLHLNDNVKLVGLRENPYVYIKNSHVFVQSSRFEGKSIVLDEAKIFCKPIVVTNYPTVYDSIEDRINGSIVPMNSDSLADGIYDLLRNEGLRKKYADELKNNNLGNEQEVNKYIELMLK